MTSTVGNSLIATSLVATEYNLTHKMANHFVSHLDCHVHFCLGRNDDIRQWRWGRFLRNSGTIILPKRVCLFRSHVARKETILKIRLSNKTRSTCAAMPVFRGSILHYTILQYSKCSSDMPRTFIWSSVSRCLGSGTNMASIIDLDSWENHLRRFTKVRKSTAWRLLSS